MIKSVTFWQLIMTIFWSQNIFFSSKIATNENIKWFWYFYHNKIFIQKINLRAFFNFSYDKLKKKIAKILINTFYIIKIIYP